ncbi:MAG: tetratricopeptide repeat protein [Gemmatimonadota bacterium]|nr:tetratricopeptide repeat protein [Gemmatimonadota bacterium]
MRTTHSLLVMAAIGAAGCRPAAEQDSAAAIVETSAHRATESRRIRDEDISFYQARVARDPYGARDRAVLGALYLQRARSSGSESDILRAESLARASVTARHQRNASALSVLISSLMAQHRFAEAHVAAEQLLDRDSSNLGALATLGEVALELGRYDEAAQIFSSVALTRSAPAIAPRYARWLELTGRSGEARQMLEALRDSLATGFRVPAEQFAWLELRIGELAAKNGRSDLARTNYARGLALLPEDPQLLAASARLSAAEGDWRNAMILAEQALAGRFDPMTLALLAEGHAVQGDTAQAAEYTRAMEVAVSKQPSGFHRGWALFLLDHGRRIEDMLDRARSDYATRTDVYGADLLGWALHRSGQDLAGAPYAAAALAQHTRDGLLYYHAGMIAYALGDMPLARSRLTEALAINPRFAPFAADTARATLATLAVERR